ncbi:MAG TPA: SMC family ATPase [Abditibacteriaceae bacterium]
MIPITLHLSNFLSYGENLPPLDFTQFHTACLSGNNGNGKSAILDALTWALWGQARNATPSLLRLGQSEMRVEFVFDLDGERYRVSRGYLKNKRSSATLELNVLDTDSGLYRAITRASVRETQEQVDGLLRMDYETFLSSAYLKQGQADRFSKQPPGQRKQVLAEILGLARYQEIADKARAESRINEARVEALDAQIESIEAFLGTRTEAQRLFNLYSEAIEQFAPEIERLQDVVEAKTAQKIRLDERRKRALQIAGEVAEATARLDRAKSARAELVRQQNDINDWQAQSDSIVADLELYRKAKDDLARWDAVAEKFAALRDEHARLKEHIDNAAATLRTRLNELDAQIAHEENIAAQSRTQLQDSDSVRGRAKELETAREEEEAHARRRVAYDAALQSVREAENALRAARLQSESELSALQRELLEAENAATRAQQLAPEVARIEAELAQLDEAHSSVDALQNQRIEFEARLAQLKQHVDAERAAIAASEQKLKVLQANPNAQCPLCRSGLGEHGREHIEESIEDEITNANARVDEYTAEGRLVKQKKAAVGAPLEAAQAKLRDAPRLNAEAARLRHALEDANKVRSNSGGLQQQVEAAHAALERGDFAPELAARAKSFQAELDAVGYDAAAHEAAATRVRELAPVERELHELRFAEDKLSAAEAKTAELQPERAEIATQLESGSFAAAESRELARVKAEGEKLAYNKDAKIAHRAARDEEQRLSNAPIRWDRLQNVLANADRVARATEENTQATRELEATVQRLEAEEKGLGDVAIQAAECERALNAAQAELRVVRDRKSEADTELGKQHALLDECTRRETERGVLAEERKEKARECHVLKETAKAFGKDGIQALIIENAIPEIQDDANQILRRLTRNTMQISLESQREKQSGGTRETLDIKISDDRGTREYLLFSGGEAFRADFALRIALSKLLARRAGTQLRTLIIDEGFGTQDKEGLSQMIECIQTIADDFSKVLVVTHLDEIKNAFPTRIEVVKDAASGSRYEVITA